MRVYQVYVHVHLSSVPAHPVCVCVCVLCVVCVCVVCVCVPNVVCFTLNHHLGARICNPHYKSQTFGKFYTFKSKIYQFG